MTITSPAFENNQPIPSNYTCDGENVNPPLVFHDVPENAESLVLIVEDPDAPQGTFLHWLVFNISPKVTKVEEHDVPGEGEEGLNDGGKQGYTGPCPPSGTHRYFFKLYALDTQLQIEGDPDVDIVRQYMIEHILDKAELVGLYSRYD